jgi:transposase
MSKKISDIVRAKVTEDATKGLTQRELAKKHGISERSAYLILRDTRDMRGELAREAAKKTLARTIPKDLETFDFILDELHVWYTKAKSADEARDAIYVLDNMRKTISDRLKFSGLDSSKDTVKDVLELLKQ